MFKNIRILFIILYCLLQSSLVYGIEIKNLGGLKVSDAPTPNYVFYVGGLIQLDETAFSGSAYDTQGQFQSGALIRRLYLDIGGTIAKNWSFNFNTSIQARRPQNAITAILRDMCLNYTGIENSYFQFGQVGIPSSLENWGYNSDLFLIDTALPVDAFFPNNDFGIGIYADRNFLDMFTVAGVVYQPRRELSFNGQVGLGRSDRLSEALRFTFAPIHTKTCIAHFGIWGRNEAFTYTFKGNAIPLAFCFQGYNAEPEAEARNTGSLVDSGPIRTKANFLSGIEIAGVYGPFMIQAEYMGSRLRQMYTNLDPAVFVNNSLWFKGWYAQGSYVLTGESHRYDFPLGIFRRPIPECWYGAWEIVARFSNLNLNSKNIIGGVENNLSVGLNWYVNSVLRFCSNYIHASSHPSLSSPNDANNFRKRKLDIFAVRIQIAF